VARRAIGRVTPAAEAKSIGLELEALTPIGTCETDSHRVEQILINLLGNAIRHSPDRTVVRVRVLGWEDRVVFEVQDQGPGIKPEDFERVFDIYETKPGEGGVGLGLPLSRRLARLLGGELRAEARSDGGACFVLELPVANSVKVP
jgi:signal transduction histidine kinase